MSRVVIPIGGPAVRPEHLASCAHCGQLVLLVDYPLPLTGSPDTFLRWNPSYVDQAEILGLLDGAGGCRRFGPPGYLHRDTCQGRPS